MAGIVISIGGLQESLRKTSLSALLEYLKATESKDSKESITRELSLCEDVVWVLDKYRKCDRVIIPTLKVPLSLKLIILILYV